MALKVNTVPRYRPGSGQGKVMSRARYLDGTNRVYWAPSQPTNGNQRTAEVYSLGAYAPPTDWPPLHYPITLPRVVNFCNAVSITPYSASRWLAWLLTFNTIAAALSGLVTTRETPSGLAPDYLRTLAPRLEDVNSGFLGGDVLDVVVFSTLGGPNNYGAYGPLASDPRFAAANPPATLAANYADALDCLTRAYPQFRNRQTWLYYDSAPWNIIPPAGDNVPGGEVFRWEGYEIIGVDPLFGTGDLVGLTPVYTNNAFTTPQGPYDRLGSPSRGYWYPYHDVSAAGRAYEAGFAAQVASDLAAYGVVYKGEVDYRTPPTTAIISDIKAYYGLH